MLQNRPTAKTEKRRELGALLPQSNPQPETPDVQSVTVTAPAMQQAGFFRNLITFFFYGVNAILGPHEEKPNDVPPEPPGYVVQQPPAGQGPGSGKGSGSSGNNGSSGQPRPPTVAPSVPWYDDFFDWILEHPIPE